MTTNNNCKGCATTDTCEYMEKADECPCKICLVKGMCDMTCDDYLTFAGLTVTFNTHTGTGYEIEYKPIVARYAKRSIFGRK